MKTIDEILKYCTEKESFHWAAGLNANNEKAHTKADIYRDVINFINQQPEVKSENE